MTEYAMTLGDALNLAVNHYQSGNVDHSRSVCDAILEADPKNADALHILSFIAHHEGKTGDAIAYVQKALESRPDDVELHNNCGNFLKANGDLNGAIKHYRLALQIDSKCSAAYFNLGNALSLAGDPENAIAAFRQAAILEPEVPSIHYNLGIELRRIGQIQLAIEEYRKALELHPDYFEAHVNLGIALFDLEQTEEAIQSYERAKELNPDSTPLLNNLGVALTAKGSYAEALNVLEKAVQLEPKFVEGRNNLAVAQRLSGNFRGAMDNLTFSVNNRPNYQEAYRNLGSVLVSLGQFENAITEYKRSIEIEPDYYDAWLELGTVYISTGDGEAARHAFSKASQIAPTAVVPKWGETFAQIPSFYQTPEQTKNALEGYRKSLAELNRKLDLSNDTVVKEAALAVGFLQPFFLSCQEINTRDLQSRYGDLVCRIMAARYPQWAEPIAKPRLSPGERIRVGFVSRHFSNHADWKMLTGGWVQELNRSQFQVYGYSTGGVADDTTERAKELFDRYSDNLGFEQLCAKIKADNLHVLIFPETGQDPVTLRAAALRLAPVQCSAWGLPMTSGLPTIDYYLTSDAMEPENAQEHYTETLVRLPGLSSYYMPANISPKTSTLRSYGVRLDDSVRYLCVQSLFKYLPQYDHIFPRIAQRVPKAQFLFAAKPDGLANKMHERLRRAFDRYGIDCSKYVTMLPKLTHEEFSGLCSISSVFLDTIEFTGCITTLEALEHNIPIVTMPGLFMRGRQSAAILSTIDVRDTIASSVDDYVEKAVELGNNPQWRNTISESIKNRVHFLYRNHEVIESLENFLRQVVAD